MKLFLNEASPYARLIRVLLVETGLENESELITVDPWNASEELLEVNPASRIPALALDNGTHLVESSCIADYLIHISGEARMSPMCYADAPQRLEILGLGRAATDSAFGSVIQRRFGADSPLTERWLGALPRVAERLDILYARRQLTTDCDQADLTVAVAFEYIDFRLPEINWRSAAPNLSEHVVSLAGRTSMVTTRPT